jgi:hypothetical protein
MGSAKGNHGGWKYPEHDAWTWCSEKHTERITRSECHVSLVYHRSACRKRQRHQQQNTRQRHQQQKTRQRHQQQTSRQLQILQQKSRQLQILQQTQFRANVENCQRVSVRVSVR